jgi:hypothetical protein
MRGDGKDYEGSVCRGDNLENTLYNLRHGFKPQYEGLTSGFSDNHKACKRFARGSTTDPKHIPSVAMESEETFKKDNPTMRKVCYTPSWLRDNPKIVEAIQTFRGEISPLEAPFTFEEKIESAMTLKDECEIMVDGEAKMSNPDVNVYLSHQEMNHMNRKNRFGYADGEYLKQYINPIKEATENIRRIKKKSGVDEYTTVRVYLCDSTYNLMDDEHSRCTLWDVL